MSEFISDKDEKMPELDKHGFTIRPPISDTDCILKCLRNCEQMCGMDKKQVARLIKEWTLKTT